MLWLNGQRLLLLQVALAHSCHRFPPGGSVNCILTQLENRLAPPHIHTYTYTHLQQRFNDISHFNLCAKFFGAFTNLFLSSYHFSSLFVFYFYRRPFRHHLDDLISLRLSIVCRASLILPDSQ